MDEKTYELEARLFAIEHMIRYIACIAVRDCPTEMIESSNAQVLEQVAKTTFPTMDVDPVLKDHMASLMHEHVQRLLAQMEETVRDTRGIDRKG